MDESQTGRTFFTFAGGCHSCSTSNVGSSRGVREGRNRREGSSSTSVQEGMGEHTLSLPHRSTLQQPFPINLINGSRGIRDERRGSRLARRAAALARERAVRGRPGAQGEVKSGLRLTMGR